MKYVLINPYNLDYCCGISTYNKIAYRVLKSSGVNCYFVSNKNTRAIERFIKKYFNTKDTIIEHPNNIYFKGLSSYYKHCRMHGDIKEISKLNKKNLKKEIKTHKRAVSNAQVVSSPVTMHNKSNIITMENPFLWNKEQNDKQLQDDPSIVRNQTKFYDIAIIGTYCNAKGYDKINNFIKKNKDKKIIIIGKNTEQLKGKIREKNVLIVGYQDRDIVMQILQNTKEYHNISYLETFSYSSMEAYFSGCDVLGNDSPALKAIKRFKKFNNIISYLNDNYVNGVKNIISNV